MNEEKIEGLNENLIMEKKESAISENKFYQFNKENGGSLAN
jgi:hypothetical protein